MKHKIAFLFTLILFCFFCGYYFFPKNSRSEKNAYFVSVPIIKFSPSQMLSVNVSIEDRVYPMYLDLGLASDLNMVESHAKEIVLKQALGSKSMYNFRGEKTEVPLYRIPEIAIQDMVFSNAVLQVDCEKSRYRTVFVQNGGAPSPQDGGLLGWRLFYTTNLLLDLHQKRIAFSNSLATLKTQGYETEDWIETPLHIESGLLAIDIELPDKQVRCVLDTGSTRNLINHQSLTEQSLETAYWDPNNWIEFSYFRINQHQLGSIGFQKLPVKLPIHVEAILGMEFFERYLVFLDFPNRRAYIAKFKP